MERRVFREIRGALKFVGSIAVIVGGLYALSLLALSDKQRKAILARDHYRCQFPVPHNCGGRLEVHHIEPQKWEEIVIRLSEEERDRPLNLITLCQNAHHTIHPDEKEFAARYKNGEKDARELIEKRRLEMCCQRREYWYSAYDDQMRTRVRELTEEAWRKGWKYPPKNGNGGWGK